MATTRNGDGQTIQLAKRLVVNCPITMAARNINCEVYIIVCKKLTFCDKVNNASHCFLFQTETAATTQRVTEHHSSKQYAHTWQHHHLQTVV